MSDNSLPEDTICLGIVSGAIGVRGELRVKTFTEGAEALGKYGPLHSDTDGRVWTVKSIRPVKGGAGVRFEGIDDRDAALALKGTQLMVSRQALGEVAEEESWFHVDLIGMEVRNIGGEPIGSVKAVQDFGAGDVLEVLLVETGKTVLVAFRRETVPTVDLAAGFLTVLLPEPDDDAKEKGDEV